MSDVKIGSSRYGKSKKTYFKMKPGSNVFRILPPIGKLADAEQWAVYHKVHYGYETTPDPKTGKAKLRPFLSPERYNWDTKMVEVPDAAKQRIDALRAAQAKAKEAGMTEKVQLISAQLQKYNLDKKWYVNAMDLQGNIGLLKIPHKAKQSLDAEIDKLQARGIAPTNVENGRYFEFTKTGEGRETQYKVNVYEEPVVVNGKTYKEEKEHTLSSDDIKKYKSEYFELSELFKAPTSEQVARMVSEGARAVDEILGGPAAANTSSDDDEEDTDAETASLVSAAQNAVNSATPQPSVTSGTVVTGAANEVKLGSTTPSGALNPADFKQQSPEEFLKSIGM